ncbi:Transmembrane protein 53 [Liparis tanakae]|uniref:Transmembrane protein 53 n=1 Tax=Liparis tanakae TaxID=230148 RepID=A0A4Z2GYS5_9TELE|nr:Transmembrane protein 53 [Liparis tanakae]
MGNLALFTGLFRSDVATPEPADGASFVSMRISDGITYYCAPSSGTGERTSRAAEDSQTSTALCPTSEQPSSSPLLSDAPSPPPASSQSQSDSSCTSRPLLLFFSWLGARPVAVGKYRDLYLDRGMDVLLVQSKVTHFLWPRWGLDYGLEVLEVLERPQFSGRALLVHASSIGGFTFTQTLAHIARGGRRHAEVGRRVTGHIYDSLVVGTREHMAIGLGKTLFPRLESLVKHAAMLYFWLFKSHTADLYDDSIQLFHDIPITAPALFFFSENDALCNTADLETLIDHWRERGVAVESRKWKESKHAAHMRCHPDDYISTLERFLNSLALPKC